MGKAILISIKPEWVAKILNGEKTIEIRKTMPNAKLPIDVYIYVTKSTYGYSVGHSIFSLNDLTLNPDTNKYQCGDSCYIMCAKKEYTKDNFLNGKVVAKFTLNKVFNINPDSENDLLFYEVISCIKPHETKNYLKNKNGYAWQIDDLQIFDKPKELSDFDLAKAPKSWCYMEEK